MADIRSSRWRCSSMTLPLRECPLDNLDLSHSTLALCSFNSLMPWDHPLLQFRFNDFKPQAGGVEKLKSPACRPYRLGEHDILNPVRAIVFTGMMRMRQRGHEMQVGHVADTWLG